MIPAPPKGSRSGAIDVALTRCVAITLAALGFLPITQWIPGGLADAAYAHRWTEWAYGIAACAGAGCVCAILFRSMSGRSGAVWRRWWARIETATGSKPSVIDVSVAVTCFVLYAVVARSVFSAKPLLIDELIQVMQARMYANGHLSVPVDSAREFFSVLHVVDTGDRVYSQFPPGWPAMLMLGVMTGTAWLVGPLCGAVSVWVFARLLRRTIVTLGPIGLAAGSALFGLAPFAVFQFSSHMSHGPVLMWLLIAVLTLSHVTDVIPMPSRVRTLWAVVMGVASGCAFAVRPLDAMAFGIPAGIWLAWRAIRDRGAIRPLLGAAVGLALPVGLVMWVNLQTTGSPLQFGYEALWGSAHGLGFHAAPWGDAHTPQRGIELLSAYVTRLNVYLFETPFPSLLPVIVSLLLITGLTQIERYLFCAVLLHAFLYFAYWHDGFFLGPRFVVPWLPLLILICARLGAPPAWRRWSTQIRAGVAGALASAILLAAIVSLPSRVAQYRTGLTSMRQDYVSEAARAGVSNALVFVRESWGAQLVARLWALGVSRTATAALYANVDACVLEHGIGDAERNGVRGKRAEMALRPLLRDSSLVRPSSVSPDSTERMLPGTRYDAVCSARVAADREGYALYPPILFERESGNTYVRDFQERDTLILLRFPNRRAFLLRRDGVDGAAPLRWIPLVSTPRLDSTSR